jgi:hypothetical protein
MRDMTAREILDAFRSGLEETSRRFAEGPYTNGRWEQPSPHAAKPEPSSTGDADRPRETATP